MLLLLFGLLWLSFSAFFAYIILGDLFDGGIIINDVLVTQEEFFELSNFLEIKIPIALFLLVGIFMIILGLKMIIKPSLINIKGKNTYGYISNIFSSGISLNRDLNHESLYDAKILLVKEDGTIGEYKTNICFKENEYIPETYVNLKYYKEKVKILDVVDEYDVPISIRNKIESFLKVNPIYKEKEINSYIEESIIIDGVEYEMKK